MPDRPGGRIKPAESFAVNTADAVAAAHPAYGVGGPPPQSPSWGRRMRGAALAVSPDAWALVALAVTVLLANGPYLLGLFHADPLDFRAGLNSALAPGLLGGKPTIDPSNGFT